tara:strand:+ start:1973 stop:2431 length:459 start_codon:yes stop_codon:yes gene_type:complete
MEGTKEDPGIYWRALSSLFDVKSKRSNAWDIDIKISILEVYNENIRDLLSDTAGKKGGVKKTLRIKMLRGGENYVEGLSMPTVKSIEQIRNYMNAGKKVRLMMMMFECVVSIQSHTHTHTQTTTGTSYGLHRHERTLESISLYALRVRGLQE